MVDGGVKLKLVFMGTPDFSVHALKSLLDAGHDVVCVYSQPPRKAGRGQKLTPSPVHAFAQSHGIEVRTPASLKGADEQAAFAALSVDAAVVVAYGLLLPQSVLDAPRLGCFNIHASLLPRWRGAAPIQRAIEAGDAKTGVTIMKMDAGLDTGDMLLTQAVPISPLDTTGSLHDRLAVLGGQLMVQALGQAEFDQLQAVPQPLADITYASKIDKAEAAIDWSQSAQTISQRVRAFNPFPGASTLLAGETLKIWSAAAGDGAFAGGQVGGQIVALTPSGMVVAALDSTLIITELQRPGGKRLASAEFLRGCPLQVGQVLG